eukprot:365661-Chlamydomonas_euryale.AAC.67
MWRWRRWWPHVHKAGGMGVLQHWNAPTQSTVQRRCLTSGLMPSPLPEWPPSNERSTRSPSSLPRAASTSARHSALIS